MVTVVLPGRHANYAHKTLTKLMLSADIKVNVSG